MKQKIGNEGRDRGTEKMDEDEIRKDMGKWEK